MSKIYAGVGYQRRLIGEYENGVIYAKEGWSRTEIGFYEGNKIYKKTGWTRTIVGEYEINGKIYTLSQSGWLKNQIGLCENGRVYVMSRLGYSKTPVGEYDGNSAGAAALLLLF